MQLIIKTMVMRATLFSIVAILTFSLFILPVFGSGNFMVLSDDFNRPDSQSVGNGWQDASGNINGDLEVKDGELTSTITTGGAAAIYQPFVFSATTTISADMKETNGFGALFNRRYSTTLYVKNNGALQNGYGIHISRSDSITSNSAVFLIDEGHIIDIIYSPFQYGSEIHVETTFGVDGSVTGTVTQQDETFNFTFPPRIIQSTGDNLGIFMEHASSGIATYIFPRLDNYVVSVETNLLEVDVDIKPGETPNNVSLHSRGILSVAILTTPVFDVTGVDPLSVRLGSNEAAALHGAGHQEDVDGDGDIDLVLHFKTQEVGILCGDTSVVLTGQTNDGELIHGSDSIRTVGCSSL